MHTLHARMFNESKTESLLRSRSPPVSDRYGVKILNWVINKSRAADTANINSSFSSASTHTLERSISRSPVKMEATSRYTRRWRIYYTHEIRLYCKTFYMRKKKINLQAERKNRFANVNFSITKRTARINTVQKYSGSIWKSTADCRCNFFLFFFYFFQFFPLRAQQRCTPRAQTSRIFK